MSSARVRDSIKDRLVEVASGLVMVVVGVLLTAWSSQSDPTLGWGIAAGGLLTALGGVLLSWVVAVETARRDAVRQLNNELEAVSRNIGHASTRISRAVEQCQAEELEAPTTFALVSQANTIIYDQIAQIQQLIGAEFDSQRGTVTFFELAKLERMLDREQPIVSSEIRTELTRLLEQARKRSAGAASSEEVECPYCRVRSAIALGNDPGTTAQIACPSCSQPYNAHRASNGTAFSRPARRARPLQGPNGTSTKESTRKQGGESAGPSSVRVLVSCATCSTNLEVSQAGDDTPKMMLCLKCLTSNFVYPMSQRAVAGAEFEHIQDPVVTGRTGNQPMLQCPACRESLRGMLNDGERRYAFCVADRRVMSISHATLDERRQAEQL